MEGRLCLLAALLPLLVVSSLDAQTIASSGTPIGAPSALAPLPEPRALLLDVERNDRRLEALRKDYTYHVHLEEQELKKDGSLKKNEVIDSESLTIHGVRINRVVARNGTPLTLLEQAKESERVDKEVAKAQDRQAKAASKGQETDERGDAMLSAARILELGSFSNERRVDLDGRPTIVLDYAGDPNAKTHSQIEGVVRDLVGTVWIDEADRVLVRGEGHFLNDFRIGAGLLADVRKGSSFRFETKRVNDAVWLPANIDGQGSIRLLLFAGFNGRLHLVASDYRQFRTSTTILPGQRQVDANGNPVQSGIVPTTQIPPNEDPSTPPKPQP